MPRLPLSPALTRALVIQGTRTALAQPARTFLVLQQQRARIHQTAASERQAQWRAIERDLHESLRQIKDITTQVKELRAAQRANRDKKTEKRAKGDPEPDDSLGWLTALNELVDEMVDGIDGIDV